jgi:hypothetical protein
MDLALVTSLCEADMHYLDEVCMLSEYEYNMSKYEYFFNTICYDYTTNKYLALEPEFNMNTI